MKLPIYQVDAFTSEVFGGNPAAVVLLEKNLPREILQAIAAENNLSETAFVYMNSDPLRLRWFTPKIEVDLCGHATLATAHILFKTKRVPEESVRFDTQSGLLTVMRDGNLLSLDFPSRPPEKVPMPKGLDAALGAKPLAAYKARSLLVEFEGQEDVAALQPRFDLVAAVDEFAVIATAPGKGADFVSRFFAPRVGVNEDPVTGSAHCTLIPFWSARLEKKKLHALQISERGGELFCEDQGERVIISGHAVEYLRGEINC